MRSAGGLERQLDPREIPSFHLEHLSETRLVLLRVRRTEFSFGEKKNENRQTAEESQVTFTP